MRCSMQLSRAPFILVLAAVALVGCQQSGGKMMTPATKPMAMADMRPTIRIKAGVSAPWKDAAGNMWLPDQGFTDGEVVERDAGMQIANTNDPAMYRSEHFSMTSFSFKVPNGQYTVKLHFAETYDGITGVGQRVFSFNVEGQDVKDFDIFKKAGAAMKADIETFNVNVTDGKLDITFTAGVENPEINAIEIIPA
jgi:endoglucanase